MNSHLAASWHYDNYEGQPEATNLALWVSTCIPLVRENQVYRPPQDFVGPRVALTPLGRKSNTILVARVALTLVAKASISHNVSDAP
jgi:hypothetical protein